jgi:hypothetical protein
MLLPSRLGSAARRLGLFGVAATIVLGLAMLGTVSPAVADQTLSQIGGGGGGGSYPGSGGSDTPVISGGGGGGGGSYPGSGGRDTPVISGGGGGGGGGSYPGSGSGDTPVISGGGGGGSNNTMSQDSTGVDPSTSPPIAPEPTSQANSPVPSAGLHQGRSHTPDVEQNAPETPPAPGQQPASDTLAEHTPAPAAGQLPQLLPRTGQPRFVTSLALAGFALTLLGAGLALPRRPARAR